MRAYRDDLKAWLNALARARGVSLSELAKGANVAVTTVTRFVNDPNWNHTLSNASIAKIEKRWDTKAPKPQGMTDTLAADFEILTENKGATGNEAETVLVTDDALNLLGYLRGDLCFVDAKRTPERGDVVLAEIRQAHRQGMRVLLAYDAPYLRGHSTSWDLGRPVLIDSDRVRILGVVVRQVRQTKQLA